jgi:hypothetical protein
MAADDFIFCRADGTPLIVATLPKHLAHAGELTMI